MNTNHVKEHLLAYLCGELEQQQVRLIQEHLATCTECKKEMETINAFWSSLSKLPQEQPSDAMRERFYDMLNDTMEQEEKLRTIPARQKIHRGWFERLFPRPIAVQFALSLILVALGTFIGLWFRQTPVPQQVPVTQQQQIPQPVQQTNNTELTQLHQEVMAMNRLLTVSLLQQQSASERLKGVSLSYKVEGSDPEITNALLQTLKYDPNVNVRLAALDALLNDRGHSSIKEELIKSLPKESSPLVQIEIVDWIIQQKEKTSLNILKSMLNNPEVNKAVKQRIQEGMHQITS